MMKDLLKRLSGWLALAGFGSMVTVAPWLEKQGHPNMAVVLPLVLLALAVVGSWIDLQDTKAELREAKEEYRAAT